MLKSFLGVETLLIAHNAKKLQCHASTIINKSYNSSKLL